MKKIKFSDFTNTDLKVLCKNYKEKNNTCDNCPFKRKNKLFCLVNLKALYTDDYNYYVTQMSREDISELIKMYYECRKEETIDKLIDLGKEEIEFK